MPAVRLISLGGTIASVDGGTGAVPVLDGTDLIASVPGLSERAVITISSHPPRPSCELTVADMVEVGREVRDGNAAGEAVVLAQGTDTLEEMAFALDAMLSPEAPVVLTGAMRPARSPGDDGPANLAAAIAVATSSEAARFGVLVVMNNEIHAAREVRKESTVSMSAFRSALTGPIGTVVEGVAKLRLLPVRRSPLGVPEAMTVPRVVLLKVVAGDDGFLLDAVHSRTVDAVVIEGFGGGHVPSTWVPNIQEIARQKPVVIASRTGAGETLEATYDYPGGERDLLARGVIPAGDLDGPKARILLALGLMHGLRGEDVRALFAGPRARSATED